MIFQTAITHWRNIAPWPQDAQVEQDLILCRALVQIFQDAGLAKALLLRGGTALHKLFTRCFAVFETRSCADEGPQRPRVAIP